MISSRFQWQCLRIENGGFLRFSSHFQDQLLTMPISMTLFQKNGIFPISNGNFWQSNYSTKWGFLFIPGSSNWVNLCLFTKKTYQQAEILHIWKIQVCPSSNNRVFLVFCLVATTCRHFYITLIWGHQYLVQHCHARNTSRCKPCLGLNYHFGVTNQPAVRSPGQICPEELDWSCWDVHCIE